MCICRLTLDRRLDADTLLGSDDNNDGYKFEPVVDGIAASESVPCTYGDGVGKALVALGAGAGADPDADIVGAEEEEVAVADDDVVALLCCFLAFLRRAILMAV